MTTIEPRDSAQGTALLDAIAEAMPHYSLVEALAVDLPVELRPFFEQWRSDRAGRSAS